MANIEAFVGKLTKEETEALLRHVLAMMTNDAMIEVLNEELSVDVKDELTARWVDDRIARWVDEKD